MVSVGGWSKQHLMGNPDKRCAQIYSKMQAVVFNRYTNDANLLTFQRICSDIH